MSTSKNFIKSAVGILIVVAVCFVAVTIYKKGNDSINNSLNDYDKIVAQFENANLKNYDNATASGSQIVDLLKNLKEEECVTIEVSNGYTLKNNMEAQKYNYALIHAVNSTVLNDVMDKNNSARYINPNAEFASTVVYDANKDIASVVFEQK